MAWGVAFEGTSGSTKLTTPEEFRLLVFNTFTAGTLSGGAVTQRAAGANTSVDVAALTGVVQGPASLGGTTRYLVTNDAAGNTGSIGSAPGSNHRNDIIGYYQEDPDAPGSSDTLRLPRYRVLTGSGHSTATPPGSVYGATGDPTLPDRFQPLARVRWYAGMGSIINAQIDDLRVWATLARDVVDDAQATRLGTDAATAGSIPRRDANGRFKVADPAVPADVANMSYALAVANSGANVAITSSNAYTDAVVASAATALENYVTAAITAVGGTLTNGMTTVEYYKLGNMVFVYGDVQVGQNVTIPANFRPGVNKDIENSLGGGVRITTAGVLSNTGSTGPAHFEAFYRQVN